MYRYEGMIPLPNAAEAELVLGMEALDLWVADVQDVFPALMYVARCKIFTPQSLKKYKKSRILQGAVRRYKLHTKLKCPLIRSFCIEIYTL